MFQKFKLWKAWKAAGFSAMLLTVRLVTRRNLGYRSASAEG
jgi:hypothetical protein